MEKAIEFKRKIYQQLVDWYHESNKFPIIVDGLRQVGKSYIVNKFAHEMFANVITFDFRHNKVLRKIFDGNLDVNTIIQNSAPYFPKQSFIPYQTILIFEEIGDCPMARTSLKSFAQDGRFCVMATGSLLGVLNYRKQQKVDLPTGYEKIIQMSSLDFEEFLWANGVNEENVTILKEYVIKQQPLPTALADYYKEMIKRYVLVGGMPGAIKRFLSTNSYIESRVYLEGLLQDYRGDFGRFINDRQEEQIDYKLQTQLNQVFDSIPAQLARETEIKKFKYAAIKTGGRSTEFSEPFSWLEKAGLVLRCFNVRAIEKPLEANVDKNHFKAFISDIGLLMAMYPLSTSQEFLLDQLDSRKGAIFENLAAIMIKKANFPLYYFSNGRDHLEIDYLLESHKGIVLIEEKSTNGKMAASRAVMEGKSPYKASVCYKVIPTNFGQGSFYITIPQYALSFILEQCLIELKRGLELNPLNFPKSNQ